MRCHRLPIVAPDRQRVLKSFGNAVRSARLDHGLSQEKLGFECGLDRTYISGIERGVRNPTLVVIAQIARALRLAPSVLLELGERARKRVD